MTGDPAIDVGGGDVRWPEEQFYWALLDARQLGVAPTVRQLGYLLESDLPVPLETVHAAFVKLSDGRHVACAAPIEAVRSVRDGGARTFGPDSVPAFVDAPVDPRRLNLLHGRFTAPAVRRMELAAHAVLLASVVAIAAVLVAGLRARVGAEAAAATATESMRRDVLASVLGDAGRGPTADLLLTTELSRLRATRRALTADMRATLPDATVRLGDLLAAWPTDVHLLTESLSVRETGIAVVGGVASTDDAQRVADAMTAFARGASPGWRLDQPRFETRRDGIVVTLRLRPEATAP